MAKSTKKQRRDLFYKTRTHNTRTTCWEDPRLSFVPAYLKQQQQYNHGISSVSSANSSNSVSPLLMLNTNQANSTQSVGSFK